MGYLPRTIDRSLELGLSALGAIVIEGPKACGKTATGLHHAASSVRLDTDPGARAMVNVDPRVVLSGKSPRLIDEWQVEPSLWNHVRKEIDDRGERGQFILTGSAVPADDITRHSGAGRIGRLRMRTMSLYESQHSSGAISLEAIMDGAEIAPQASELSVPEIAERICIGGWPAHLDTSVELAQTAVAAYIEETVRTDVSQLDSTRRDPVRMRRLIRALARNVGTQASATKISSEATGEDVRLHGDTAREYLSALDRLMVTDDLPAWSPHLRSRATLRTSPTRHFVDPSIAASALGASPRTLLADGNTFGFMFESMAVRDLRIYAQAISGEVAHYRDDAGLEVDAVVTLRDGRWAAFEIKLGEGRADEGAANLIKFRDKIDTAKLGEPAALVVITGGQYAYRRPADGIAIVPLATLGP